MTLLAGIVSLNGRLRMSEARLAGFRRAISRNPSDVPTVVQAESYLIAKVDIGVFSEPALCVDEEAITVVAGEPILYDDPAPPRSRARDTAIIHSALKAKRHDPLRTARGTFACAHLCRRDGELLLATDKLGVRPVYWWTDGDHVVFSSALRMLESLDWVVKRLDMRGVAEQLAFGFPLGTRTPYETISLLRPGELLICNRERVRSEDYWRWQGVSRSTRSLDDLLEDAYTAFVGAVRVRQRDDRHATAFLSGGLDSRCVVAALRSGNVEVHSFNFARPDSEDRVYGAVLARAAGTVHEEHLVSDEINVRWSEMIAQARNASSEEIAQRVERPGLVWSGDGGSVGLGHVYLRPEIVSACQAGDLDAAADLYVAAERASVPERLLRKQAAADMLGAPRVGVREELSRLRTPSLLQTFYLMLMYNDQHRHLFHHFEDVDQHRIELQLPFFDAEFFSVIASVPLEARLYHRFYGRWLKHFPPYVSNTYWQAYPGHEQCPIPGTDELTYQWDPASTAAKRHAARRASVRAGIRTLLSPTFAKKMMKRRILALATVVQATGLRDMDHIIYSARAIQQYWDACRGGSGKVHLSTR